MSPHPAAVAARRAIDAVTTKDRTTWLATYADAAVLHDPVGGSPLDPDGVGIGGRAALERFWDLTVAPNGIAFDVRELHSAGDEAAVVATVSVRFPTGAEASYDGVFVYAVDADGRIASMRGYWDLERVLAAFG